MTGAPRPIRVLCVDDHRLMREGVARIVGVHPDMEVVGGASNGEQAVAQFVEQRPDVTLMDLQLPVVNGIEAIRRIRQIDASARIVVLTMYEGDENIHRAFDAGAMGYVLKDAIPDDLIHVIREVHAGRRVMGPDIQRALAQRATQRTLTVREQQVLELLSRGMRNKEIASALGITADTTGAHVKSIYAKFGVHDRTAALAEAIRRGLIYIK
jgi:two-component system, NarL family, response regulator